jgi:hypothetical protein
MFFSDRVWRLLSLGPFSKKIRQSLGLDRRLWHVGYVEPHELECPLGEPSHGETVPDNFSESKLGYHADRVALEIVQELALRN